MPTRSFFVPVMLILIFMLIGLGLYFTLDAYSRLTMAIAQNTDMLQRLSDNSGSQNFFAPNNNAQNNQTANAEKINIANAEYFPWHAKRGGTRFSALPSFSGNFNTLIRSEASTSLIWDICSDRLALRNLNNIMEWEPQLAESWEKSADGLTYIIKLRKNATWHHYTDPVTKAKIPAKPVTADDFVFFWECLQNPDIPCESLRNYYNMLKSVEKIDDHTFRVTWSEPYSFSEIYTLNMTPLPRHYYRPDPQMTDKEFADYLKTTARNMYIVGCGAYRFASFKPNDSLTLELYENYYGLKPPMNKIVYRIIPEPNVQLVEFEKGALSDLLLQPEQWVKETPSPRYYTVTPEIKTASVDAFNWNVLKEKNETPANYQWEKFQYTGQVTIWTYIGYNLAEPLFQDKRVRQALAMLTDRERILREVHLGFGNLTNGPFVNASPYADLTMKPMPFSPNDAKKLLSEAGWRDVDGDGILEKEIDGQLRKFTFTLLYNNTSPSRRKIATILQAELKKAGIDMQINPLDWSVIIQKVEEKAFSAVVMGWQGPLEPDPYQIWHSSQAKLSGSSNHINFINPEADKLIEAGRKEMDKEKRLKIYHEFYRLIADEQPYTFLTSSVFLIAQKKELRNVQIYKLGMYEYFQWLP